jgi:hypothetical protein
MRSSPQSVVTDEFVACVLMLFVWAGCEASRDTSQDAGEEGAPSDVSGENSFESDAVGAGGMKCMAGTYVASRGANGEVQACSACPSGHFSSGMNAERCTPWSDCAPGSYVRHAASMMQDRTCEACPLGTSSAVPNQAMCTAAGTCPAGTVHHAGGGPTACDACEPGSHCAGGLASVLWTRTVNSREYWAWPRRGT